MSEHASAACRKLNYSAGRERRKKGKEYKGKVEEEEGKEREKERKKERKEKRWGARRIESRNKDCCKKNGKEWNRRKGQNCERKDRKRKEGEAGKGRKDEEEMVGEEKRVKM